MNRIIDNRYKIIKEIGHGGMSIVYLAEDIRIQKKWAIKEIKKVNVENYNIIKKSLIAETEFLKKLDHPNLPRIVDVIEKGDSILIVMDYIEGENLKKILLKEDTIDESTVIKWAVELCKVLYYLHTRKPPIIYRDLKPSNIMLKKDGRIMLIDFGTAREFEKGKTSQDTICLGTRGYAAPEQYGGENQTDEKTDIYCFGVTLYHLLTGKNPEKPPYKIYPIRYWNAALSTGMEQVVGKCTQINPKERYENMLEVQYDLENLEKKNQDYVRKEYKKLGIYLLTVVCVMVSLIFTMGIKVYREKNTTEIVNSYLFNARRSMVEEDVEAYYKKALELEPDNTKIYQAMLDHYIKPNDFHVPEALRFTSLLETRYANETVFERLKKGNTEYYGELCYSVGIGYFYYMGGITGKQEAKSWFEEVHQQKNTFDEKRRERAILYEMICRYYNDFLCKGKDQSGEGMTEGYYDFYKVLHRLNQVKITKGSTDSEVATAYLISKEVAMEIYNYAYEFLEDERVTYKKLKDELNILASEDGKADRITVMKNRCSKEEIASLYEIIEDAEQKLYMVQQK